ncbi:AprI/Inh family metalloprotease inhibitor (plasmid) [Methylocapsa polymorpha]|uniref:AprI/Inh family metalloprotease inhibitor n=1 Tax=Methylocapsa polymorpha TaxID=3080828 RepID=A0ABZ0HY10_9HYPH|nr:AprI/Inh family metalloprotease inhibitor [Methylocapsa sp. RX1]WOJ91686.1 AprI/Inh family metalloprotease inhibitor [Methylocapsa sp. RX1]
MRTNHEGPRDIRARTAWLAALIFAASLLCCDRALAITLVRAETGQWDLSQDGANKSCRVTLQAGPVTSSRRGLGMPAGCRRALPILARVESWSLVGDDHLDFADTTGEPLLDFTEQSEGYFLASGPQGETYRLVSVERVPQRTPFAASQSGAKPGQETGKAKGQEAGQETGQQPVQIATKGNAPGGAIRPADVAGRYSILREGGKDAGCMLTLDDKEAGRGGNKALLAPACRDQGIVIFDPVGWRISGGRLILTARKGHTTNLDLQADGSWLKDPKEGKSLSLKKQ